LTKYAKCPINIVAPSGGAIFLFSSLLHGETVATEIMEELLDKLKNGSTAIRYTVANKLGKMGDKTAVGPLIEAIDDPDDKVVDNAIYALGELGDRKAIPRLIRALRSGKNERIKKSAAKALGMLAAKEAVDTLISALSDEDFRVRKSAARSLGQIGDKNAVPALKKALGDPNFTVTKYVEDAIERIQGL